jgi:hypothetical protein
MLLPLAPRMTVRHGEICRLSINCYESASESVFVGGARGEGR